MNIAVIQQPATADKSANVDRGVAAATRAAAAGANVVCFAELAFEPFYPVERSGCSPKERSSIELLRLAEPVPGPTTDAFGRLAENLGIVVVLNLFERDGERTYDCSPVIDADGTLVGTTRMVHVPDYPRFHERGYYAPGDHGAPVFATAAGSIGVAICYDRHFPEYTRALALSGAELVVVPQAGALDEWPEGLFEAEMRVAAFQNGYFAALCNRVGSERSIEFAGESFVCNPGGEVVARAGRGTEEILHAEIDLAEVSRSHAARLFLPDRRPDLYGSWLHGICRPAPQTEKGGARGPSGRNAPGRTDRPGRPDGDDTP